MNPCVNCKHFAIIHPLTFYIQSEASTPEEKTSFIKGHVISHGFCMRATVVNPVTALSEHPLAINERRFGECGIEGKHFESPTQTTEETQ